MLVLFFTNLSVDGFGQVDETNSVNSSYKKLLTPPSPNAASLFKFEDIPVSGHTGTPSVNIPLVTVKGKYLSHTFGLSYHASGIKVNEVASSVGLGWALQGTNVITRVVEGLPDESSNGYKSTNTFETTMDQVAAGTLLMTNSTVQSALKNAYDKILDIKPDIFSFSAGGYSGKFFYKSDGTIAITPHQDVKITRVTQIFDDEGAVAKGYWKILLPSGVAYFYGGDYADLTQTENSCSPDPEPPVTTSWFLKAIVHPYGEKILFKYNTQPYSYAAHRTQTTYALAVGSGANPAACPNAKCPVSTDQTCETLKEGYEFSVSEVKTIYEKLAFKYSNRSDLSTQKLDSVSWYSIDNAYLGKWQMSYDYFNSTGMPYFVEHLKRLKLTQVQQFGASNTSLPPYTINYSDETVDESLRLPPRLGSQDHWGYANGAGEGSLLAYTYVYPNSVNRTIQATNNREPDAVRMKAGSIREIIYPTGGKTVFEFEPHNLNSYADFTTTSEESLSASDVQLKEKIVTFATNTLAKAFYSFFNTVFVGDVAGAFVEIRNNVTGEVILSESGGNRDSVILLPAGTYKFTAQSTIMNERASLVVKWSIVTPNAIPKIYGGIRIKKMTRSESSTTTTPIITVYKYNRGNHSNTFRYVKSDKTYVLCTAGGLSAANKICGIQYISSDNFGVQKSFNGSHIGYSEVEIWKGENAEGGKSIMTFLLNNSMNEGYKTGLLTQQIDYGKQNNSFVEVKKTINTYDFRETKTLNNALRRGYDIFGKLPAVYNNAEIPSYLKPASFPVKSYWFYLKASETTQDGITTRVENTFDETNGAHTQAIKTETTNSNNAVYRVESQYTWLRDNILALTQAKAFNGTTLMGGTKNEYKDFTNSSGHIKALQWRWSNFDRNDNAIIRAVVPDDGYTSDGLIYKIKETGFNIDQVYTWDNGLLEQKSFGGLNWYYDYYPATSLFSRLPRLITDENGLRTKFTYDPFLRLSQTQNRFLGTDINNPQDVQATTLYNYHYKGQPATNASDVNQNFVGTTTTFKGVTPPLSTKQYLDGLGRPMEVVKELYTPSNLHQKNYISYDELGRQNKTYLPFESNTLGFEAASTSLSVHPRVETFFEASPLSRPIRQKNVDLTNTYISYGANTAADAVQIMTPLTNTSALVSASSASIYAANLLYKTTMTDENGKLTCVFKDKLGRVLLTRKFLDGATGANVDTYNVYDDYGQLVVVVPPGALTISGATASVVNELTFQYKYDNKNRLSAKKVPSAAVQKFYYDSRDLLVLTQDGNMAAESATKHLATLYDDIGRVVKTGFVTASPTEGADYVLTDAQITDKLTETQYYANSTWVKHQGAKVLKSAGITTPTNFVWSYTERRAGLTYTGNPIWQGKQHLRYPSVSQLPITDNDTYGVDWSVSGYNGMQQPDLTIRYLFEGGAGEVRTWQNFTYDNGRRLTDVKYNYTTGGAYIASATYTLSNMVYNFKDQLIEKNIGLNAANTGALQSIDYQYNTRGWLTNINNVVLNNNGGNPNAINIMTPTTLGSGVIQNMAIAPFVNRALSDAIKPYQSANANEMPPINDNNADLFSQNITYEGPATQSGATPQYNGNISSTTWQVLGRAKQAYGFAYDGLDRLTNATYFDITDQTVAPFTSQYSTDNKFKEAVQYDVRGNIISLQRNGLNEGTWTTKDGYVAGTYGMIDNLVYNYKPNPTATDLSTPTVNTQSNKLLNVKDASLSNKGFKYISANGVPTYTYDANGNLTSDLNKNIAEIKYNYLNLPLLIRFAAPDGFVRTIEFVYDATGVKLRKIAKIATSTQTYSTETYDYINGVEYKNDVLQRIAHTEGSVSKNENGALEHQYVLRDHLGNARVTFRDGINKGDPYIDWSTWTSVNPNAGNVGYNDGVVSSEDIMQVNHYYSFGLNMEGNWQGGASGQNKYQYNGKELNQDFGLDWNDYGARFYDAAIGRWTAVDPLAQKYLNMSPYNYVENNPILKIDVKGQWAVSVHYAMTIRSLHKYGVTNVNQKDLLGNYASVFADHPNNGNIVDANNYIFSMGVTYKKYIDYSLTQNSQEEKWEGGSGTNYNTWHSMKSNWEEESNTISDADATVRGMEFGWSKIFEAASSGVSLNNLTKNSKPIEAFGQGVHALQDAYAHLGVNIKRHDVVNDVFGDTSGAEKMTDSAVQVYKLMSKDFSGLNNDVTKINVYGMTASQKTQLIQVINEFLKQKK